MLKRLFLLCVLLASACLFYGFVIEPERLAVREHVLDVGLSDPVTLVLVSDLHAGGNHIDAPRVGEVVAAINRQSPDLVVLTGDYVVGSDPWGVRSFAENEAIFNALAELEDLQAEQGIYAVLGNHDHWYGGAYVRARLERHGVAFIDNEVRDVAGLCLFGIGDEWEGAPKPETMRACADGPRVGLMHNPDTAFTLPGRADLLLAGHTHGGQINLPLLGRTVTATESGKPYAYGRVNVKGSPMIVTSGVGMSVLPARFRAPPEIVVITLR